MKKTDADYLQLAIKLGKFNQTTIEQIKQLRLSGRAVLGMVKSQRSEPWKKSAAEQIEQLYAKKLKTQVEEGS